MTKEFRREFQEYREKYWPAVAEVVDRAVVDAGLEGTTLASMIAYQMNSGGKRLRAVLPLMMAEALGRSPVELVPFGAACELIHNATLVHDDLQDGDRTRRGEPAVWVKYGAAQAINLGDGLLYLAPRCLEYLEIEDSLRWSVTMEVLQQVLQVIDGQEREFALDFETATVNDYERMVEGKTSGLFAVPLVGAARIGGADEAMVTGLAEACGHLGGLFQIQDDVLDLYGEKGRETPGGDLREGKISALVLAFREIADGDDRARLGRLVNSDREAVEESEVQWAIEAFRSQGALQSVLEAIETRRQRARSVEGLDDYPKVRQFVDSMAELFLAPIAHLINESESNIPREGR